LIKGNPEGTIAGIIGGIGEDIFSSIAFGINSMGCMITSYLIGIIEKKIYKDNIFIPGIFAFVGTIMKEMIVFLFLYLTRAQRSIAADMMDIIIPEAIYNTIMAVIFYRLFVKLSRRFSIGKHGSLNT
jgi:rod shape-determining protein MreD